MKLRIVTIQQRFSIRDFTATGVLSPKGIDPMPLRRQNLPHPADWRALSQDPSRNASPVNRIPSGPSTRAAARLALPTRGLTVLAVSVLLALAIPQPAAQAQEAPLSLNIPAQSLEGALTQLATQAALELAYAPDTVRGMKAPAVSGTLTPDQALRALLAGTGLVFERSGSSVSVQLDHRRHGLLHHRRHEHGDQAAADHPGNAPVGQRGHPAEAGRLCDADDR
ncbi:hypothetical protein G6F68_014087 [Rhizopus microsporus]|nr:hypothetical protein G6F68_014087 [Rhizopus microsporus]